MFKIIACFPTSIKMSNKKWYFLLQNILIKLACSSFGTWLSLTKRSPHHVQVSNAPNNQVLLSHMRWCSGHPERATQLIGEPELTDRVVPILSLFQRCYCFQEIANVVPPIAILGRSSCSSAKSRHSTD